MSPASVQEALQSTSPSARKAQGLTAHSLLASLTSSLIISAAEIMAFILLSPGSRGLKTLPVSGRRIIEVIRAAFPKRALHLDSCGLDEFFFRRYLWLIVKLFLPPVFTTMPILISLNVTRSAKSDVQGLDRLSWNGMETSRNSIYWVHLVLQIAFYIYFCLAIRAETRFFIFYRQQHLQSSTRTSTILVRGIPQSYMSVEALSKIYNTVGQGVDRIWLYRDDAALRGKFSRREKLIDALEVSETSLIVRAVKSQSRSIQASGASRNHSDRTKQCSMKLPDGLWSRYLEPADRETTSLCWRWLPTCFPGRDTVDAIQHYREEIAKLNKQIIADVSRLEQSPAKDTAILEFNRPLDAHLVVQAVPHLAAYRFRSEVLNVSADFFDRSSYNLRWWEVYLRAGLVAACIILLNLGWALPVAFTGFLSQLAYLEGIWPGVAKLPKWLLSLIQGVLPQCMLVVLTALVPSMIQLLVQQLRLSQASWIGLHVQRLYFSFLFLQIFLTVAISTSVTTMIDQIYHGADSVLRLLAQNLPKSSNYFLSFLMLQAFSRSAGRLVQPFGLFQYHILSRRDKSPRRQHRRQANARLQNWSTLYPVYTNLACIGIIYLIIAPLVAVFTLVAFSLFSLSFLCEARRVSQSDYGGLLHLAALNQLFIGVYVQQICLIGLYFSIQDTGLRCACIGQATITIISLGLTIWFQVHLHITQSKLAYHLPIVDSGHGRESSHQSLLASVFRKSHRYTAEKASCHHDHAAEQSLDVFIPNALSARLPVVWIPRDPLGISTDEIAQAPNLLILQANAKVDIRGRLETPGPAPDEGPS